MGCWDGTNAQQYSGFVTWTKNGRTCQAWATQEPHKHGYGVDDKFKIDGSAAEAENTCRAFEGDERPWCYTTNKDIRWEWCDIPICTHAFVTS